MIATRRNDAYFSVRCTAQQCPHTAYSFRSDSEFYYHRISAVKQWKLLRGSQSKKNVFFDFSRVSPGDQPLAKEPDDSGY